MAVMRFQSIGLSGPAFGGRGRVKQPSRYRARQVAAFLLAHGFERTGVADRGQTDVFVHRNGCQTSVRLPHKPAEPVSHTALSRVRHQLAPLQLTLPQPEEV